MDLFEITLDSVYNLGKSILVFADCVTFKKYKKCAKILEFHRI
jgi:hypothetical protein